MNLKLAKRIRRTLRASDPGMNLRDREYERHAIRSNWRVSPTSPRGQYLRVKRLAYANGFA